MSDSDGKWVVPALLVLVLVGVSSIGFANSDSGRSPESIMDEWKKSWLGKTVDGCFHRELIRPCASSPPPACCVGEGVEVKDSCLLVIPPGNDGAMRRVGMRTAASSNVKATVEAEAEGEKHSQVLKWKIDENNHARARATADFGPEPAVLVVSCAQSCAVDFD